MNIIVDTTVWSLFLRREQATNKPHTQQLKAYIQQGHAQILGIVRQELLSGIKETSQFTKLSNLLEGFPDILATSNDHVTAAQFFNICRKKGIQGAPVDFLICAISHRMNARILTTDKDFKHYAKHIPVELVL